MKGILTMKEERCLCRGCANQLPCFCLMLVRRLYRLRITGRIDAPGHARHGVRILLFTSLIPLPISCRTFSAPRLKGHALRSAKRRRRRQPVGT